MKQVPCPGPTNNRGHRTKFSCPRFVHPWMPKVKKTFVNKGCIQCSPLLSPPFHHNYLQQQECDEPIINNVKNEWYWCVLVCVCHFVAALVSAQYVPDAVRYWRRRLIATPLPILLCVSLFFFFVVVMLVLKVVITGYVSSKSLTLRLLMSYIYIYIYIYGAPILDVSRSHTTTQHSR